MSACTCALHPTNLKRPLETRAWLAADLQALCLSHDGEGDEKLPGRNANLRFRSRASVRCWRRREIRK